MAVYDWGLSHVYLPQLDAQGAVHKYADITVSDRWGVLSPMYFYGDSLGDTPAKMSPRPGVIDLWADDPMRVDIEVRLAEGTYTLHGVDMYGDPTEMALTNNRLEVAAAPTLSPDLVLRGDSDTEASFHDYASDLDRTVGGESGTVGFYGSDGTTKGTVIDYGEEPSVTALLEALQGLGLLDIGAVPVPPDYLLFPTTTPDYYSGNAGRIYATSVDQRIYLIGGYNASSVLEGKVYVWDSETDIWNTKTPMPVPKQNFLPVAIGPKVYCAGGNNSLGADTNSLHEYDTETDTWTTKAVMPGATSGPGTATIGTKVYATKGTALWEWDQASNTWTTKAPLPADYFDMRMVALGTQLHLFGGQKFNAGFGSYMDTADHLRWDQASNTWTTLSARTSAGGSTSNINAVAVKDQAIYAVDTGPQGLLFRYTSGVGWEALPQVRLPTLFGTPAIAAIEGRVFYLAGGLGSDGTWKDHYGWTSAPPNSTNDPTFARYATSVEFSLKTLGALDTPGARYWFEPIESPSQTRVTWADGDRVDLVPRDATHHTMWEVHRDNLGAPMHSGRVVGLAWTAAQGYTPTERRSTWVWELITGL